VLALVLAALVAVTPTTSVPAAIRIVSQQARWTGLGPPDALGDDREPWFLISGEIENVGRRAIPHVRLIYELLVDDHVVAREIGYNRSAEALRDPQVESGAVNASALHIAPLGPGRRDGFRMLFMRSDVPRFETWRVRIDNSEAAPPAPSRP